MPIQKVLVVDCKTGNQKTEDRDMTLPIPIEPVFRNPLKEIDELKIKVAALEVKV